MFRYKSLDDKLSERGWTEKVYQKEFAILCRDRAYDFYTTYAKLYATGKIELYSVQDNCQMDTTVVSTKDISLLLKYMRREGWLIA